MNSDNRPVGVFDSGVGGLSVLEQIRTDLPCETLLYVADSGYAPYGDKPADFIAERAAAITGFLLNQGAKAVVVACNTATAAAIAELRRRFTIPIIGIEPAVKPAVAITRTGVIGILATGQTVDSAKFADLLYRHGQQARVLAQPCPGLADCVEQGDLNGQRPLALLNRYLQPLLAQKIDTLVLGCTHYPFLNSLIKQIISQEIMIIDPSAAVSRQLYRVLEKFDLLADCDRPGGERYFTSGCIERTAPVIHRLLGRTVTLESLPLTSSPH